MQEIDQLVKMANQIADNFSFHEDAVDRLADPSAAILGAVHERKTDRVYGVRG